MQGFLNQVNVFTFISVRRMLFLTSIHFIAQGDFIASGSESGHVFLWNTLDKEQKHTISTKLHKTKDKARSSDYFEASKAQLPIVTDTLFFPYKSVKEALLTSHIFPFQFSMDRVEDDLSSAVSIMLLFASQRIYIQQSADLFSGNVDPRL